MTVSVELEQILNFALGTPEVGAVNFNILHGLLYEILKHLGIDKKKTEVSDNGSFRSAYAVLNRTGGEPVKDAQTNEKDALKQTLESMPYSGLLESKVSHLESRLKLLDDLPSNEEILKMAKDKRNGKTPVAELWQNINMNRRLGATEQGVEKVRMTCCVCDRHLMPLCIACVASQLVTFRSHSQSNKRRPVEFTNF